MGAGGAFDRLPGHHRQLPPRGEGELSLSLCSIIISNFAPYANFDLSQLFAESQCCGSGSGILCFLLPRTWIHDMTLVPSFIICSTTKSILVVFYPSGSRTKSRKSIAWFDNTERRLKICLKISAEQVMAENFQGLFMLPLAGKSNLDGQSL